MLYIVRNSTNENLWYSIVMHQSYIVGMELDLHLINLKVLCV